MDVKCELWIWHGKKHQERIKVSNSFDLRSFYLCIYFFLTWLLIKANLNDSSLKSSKDCTADDKVLHKIKY